MTLRVDGKEFEEVADPLLPNGNWVLQLSPDHQSYFNSIMNQSMTFDRDGIIMQGQVTQAEIHTNNTSRGNQPQLSVQIVSSN